MAPTNGGAKLSITDPLDHTAGWDWEDSHVSQSYVDSANGRTSNDSIAIHDIVEAGTVLIAAGPADLDTATGGKNLSASKIGLKIVPVGLIETAQISLNKPLSRIFEIGSKLSYIIPGRTVGGISLSRVFFDGPSLLKVLYYGEVLNDGADMANKYSQFASGNPDGLYTQTANIGSGNLAMNLASTFFDQPFGLAFFFRDLQNDTVGQTYFEGCHVSTYNLGISANMNVLTESINLEFVRCRPILTAVTTAYDGTNLVDFNIA